MAKELEDGSGVHLQLQDIDGIFLEAPPIASTDEAISESSEEEAGSVNDLEGRSNEEWREALRKANDELGEVKTALVQSKNRLQEVWSANCAQLKEFDAIVQSKDEEITFLKTQLREAGSVSSFSRKGRSSSGSSSPSPVHMDHPNRRSGKAPPIDPFSGELEETLFDDWLPSLERTSKWNGWGEADKLLQLAGHLRGKALQEWNLLEEKEKGTYTAAVSALRARLDCGGKVLAVQDFRHLAQGEKESVTELIRRLERTFRVAYGRESMSAETRDALLYSQLQEGLKYELMQASAVSGAGTYKELCIAAKNEERRFAGLKKREQYHKEVHTSQVTRAGPSFQTQPIHGEKSVQSERGAKRCYTCNREGHIARDCRVKSKKPAHQISQTHGKRPSIQQPPYNFEKKQKTEVKQIQVEDTGSCSHCVKVILQGVPVYGIIDSGSDITIIGGNLFRRIAARAKLKKDLCRPDKVPRTYN